MHCIQTNVQTLPLTPLSYGSKLRQSHWKHVYVHTAFRLVSTNITVGYVVFYEFSSRSKPNVTIISYNLVCWMSWQKMIRKLCWNRRVNCMELETLHSNWRQKSIFLWYNCSTEQYSERAVDLFLFCFPPKCLNYCFRWTTTSLEFFVDSPKAHWRL